MIFWNKFTQNGYFLSQTGQFHLCMRPWSFVTIRNFLNGGQQTQRYFNISCPSSRTDRKIIQLLSRMLLLAFWSIKNFFNRLTHFKSEVLALTSLKFILLLFILFNFCAQIIRIRKSLEKLEKCCYVRTKNP